MRNERDGRENQINKTPLQDSKYTTFVRSGRTALALRFIGLRPQRYVGDGSPPLGSKKILPVHGFLPRGTKYPPITTVTEHTFREADAPVTLMPRHLILDHRVQRFPRYRLSARHLIPGHR